MKHYYRMADAAMQLLLLIVWLFAFICKTEFAFLLYFIVGLWYLVSLAVHYKISAQSFKRAYRSFAVTIVWIIAIFLTGLIFNDILDVELLLLLFIAPVLALFYTCNCIAEIIYLRKRPISYLK